MFPHKIIGKDVTSIKSPKIAEKRRSKASKLEFAVEEPAKPIKETTLNFKLTSIANLKAYSKKININDFRVELTHQNISVKPITDVSGDIYVCPCPDDVAIVSSIDVLSLLSSPIDKDSVDEKECDIMNLDIIFNITFDPTDIKDINRLADTPLLVALYAVRESTSSPKVTIEEPEADSIKAVGGKSQKGNKKKSTSFVKILDEPLGPLTTKTIVGCAFVDLMGLIHESTVNESQQIYIYPMKVHAELRTPIITIEISSEEPLCQLPDQTICNVATITMENIFNPRDLFVSTDTKAFVDLSLITKYVPGGNHELEKIVSFTQGAFCKYQPNELLKKWNGVEDTNCIGLLTNLDVKDNLSGLYNSQNINLSAVQNDSPVIRFNAISRKLMTNEMCIDLEHLINYNKQQVLVEIRFESRGQLTEEQRNDLQSKYIGLTDLSPLLFPEVKTGRFVIPINKIDIPDIPVAPRTEKKQKTKRVPAPKIERSLSATTRETKSMEILPTKPTGALALHKDGSPGDLDSEVELKETTYRVTSMKELPLIDEEMFVIIEVSFETPITEIPKKGKIAKPTVHIYPEIESIFENETKIKVAAEAIESEFEEEIVKILNNLPYHLDAAGIFIGGKKDISNEVKRIPFLKEMQSNIVDTIMKLVAVKYNYRRNTSNSANFKNLLAVVYNDLTERIMQTVNGYFSGTDSHLALKEQDRKDLHIFLAKEFRELSFKPISEYIYKQKLNDPTNYEENLIDLAINDLENLIFDKALATVQELLIYNPRHVYGLLIQAYVEYMSHGLECIYPLLFNIIQESPDNVETWTLLYVLYKDSNYTAGFKHAQTMYEKNCMGQLEWLPYFSTRKEPYFEARFDQFAPHNCIYIFLKLGTYAFAEMVYERLKDRVEEKERIIITSAIYLLTKQNEKGLSNLQTFKQSPSNFNELQSFSHSQDLLLKLYKGHFLYAMDRKLEAIREYQVVFHSPQSNVTSQIAALRCGFWDIKEKKYETAKTYFSSCAQTMGTFLSWYGLGVCFFRTNQFDEAEMCLSKSTDLYKPFPEAWMYLAMVNLKLNKNPEATICFEAARKYNVENIELWEEMINFFNEKDALPALF